MSTIRYKLVTLSTDNTAFPALGRVESWICHGSPKDWPHPRKGAASVDVHLEEPIRSRGPLNLVYGLRLGLIRKDLLDAFGADLIAKAFSLGDVFGPGGELIEDWRTYRGRRRIILRGTKNARWQRCGTCGAVQYSSWGGRNFLWPEPDPTVPVFDDNGGFLIFREDVAELVLNRRWIGVKIKSVGVAKDPLDGFLELGAENAEYA